jgi:hypothetical protein
MSVRPSVHTEQLGSQWADLIKFDIRVLSELCREDSKVIKIGKEKKGTLHEGQYKLSIIYIAHFFSD